MRPRGNKLNVDQREYIIMKCSSRFYAEAILRKRKSFHQNIIARHQRVHGLQQFSPRPLCPRMMGIIPVEQGVEGG